MIDYQKKLTFKFIYITPNFAKKVSLALIGVSVSSQKKRGGIGINIAIGLAFVFVYIFAMKMMTVASLNVGLPVLIAVWIPNLLFSFVALFLYRFAQK